MNCAVQSLLLVDSLESDGRFCVGASGTDVAPVPPTFLHIYFTLQRNCTNFILSMQSAKITLQ
jgi:hypothetical protein